MADTTGMHERDDAVCLSYDVAMTLLILLEEATSASLNMAHRLNWLNAKPNALADLRKAMDDAAGRARIEPLGA